MGSYFNRSISKCFVSIFLTCILIVSGFVSTFTPGVLGDYVKTSFSNNSNVTANITTIAPLVVGPGNVNIGMINVSFNNSGGFFETLNWINVTVLNYSDVESVSVWNETNFDSNFSSLSDTYIGSSNVASLAGDLGYSNITGLNIGITNNTNHSVYIVFNISALAQDGDLINASISAHNMNMSLAGSGGLITLYPAYNTIIDATPPTIVSINIIDEDGNGKIENATIEFSEPIDDSTIVASQFTIGGQACSSISTLTTPDDNIIQINLATGISGTGVQDVTYTYSANTCTDLYGNELANVSSGNIEEIDSASPVILTATTDDKNKNGFIDRYYLTLSENVTVYSGFYNELEIAGYTIDADNCIQTEPKKITIVLFEGPDFDTGATPEITYPANTDNLVDIVPPMPIDIASGDLNDDSYPDIAILNSKTKTITVFLHDGINKLSQSINYPSGILRGNITIGDVNGDNLNDIAATNYDTGELIILTQNNITHKLNPQINYSAGNGTLGVAIGDVNDDERNDVVVTNYLDDKIAVFKQNSTGGLGIPTKYNAGNGPIDVVIADVMRAESYGHVLYDIVVTNYLDNTIIPYRQQTDHTLLTLTSISTPDGPVGITSGDLNQDGWFDIAVACKDDNSIAIFTQSASSWSSTSLSSSYDEYNVDQGTTDIAIIDANNNGRNDIIVTNQVNNTVSFMLQSSGATYSLGWNKTLAQTPYGLAVNDFDLNGAFDAATTQPNDNKFSLLLQKTNEISYNTRKDYYLGSNVRSYQPRNVDIGDINNDGYNDIVTTCYYTVRIAVHYGNPAGGFYDKVDYAVYESGWWYPWDVKIGDLNNDSLNDVAVTIYNTNRLAVFYQNTGGILSDPVFYTTRYNARRLAIGDLNNDSLNDVAVTNYNWQGYISVFTQNPSTGLLNPKVDYYTGLRYPYGIAIGEVSGDHLNDVVVTHDDGNNWYHMVRFKQKSDGTLDTSYDQYQWDNSQGRYFYDVEIGDMNSDGKNDIITSQRNNYYIGVWYQTAANSFATANTYYMSNHNQIYDVEISDVNKDGKDDIVAISYNNYLVSILGQESTDLSNWGYYSVGSNPHGVGVGDLNNDGYDDIVTANYGGHSITILTRNQENRNFNIGVNNPTQDYPWKIAAGDLNNDGISDIAVINQGWPYYLSVFIRNSDGTYNARKDYSTYDYPYSLAIGDVNNDGRNDVVVGTNGYYVSVYTQKMDGTLNSYVNHYQFRRPYDIAIGDVNSDGRNDVVTSCNYYFFRFLQTSSGTLSSYSSYYLSPASYLRNIAIGDLNNDSRNDVIMTSYNNDYLYYYTQTSSGALSGYYGIATNDRPIDIQITDLNNDGLNDIVNTNYGSLDSINIFTQKSSGGFNSPANYATNTNPWGLATGDFNDDGLTDVVTADLSSNTISIFTQNQNGQMNNKVSHSVYYNPRYIVADDFTGDSIEEIVITHPDYDQIYTIYPKKLIGTNSTLTQYKLGTNSLNPISTGDIIEIDGADPIFGLAITGNYTRGNSSEYTKLMVRFSEDINESTINSDGIDFSLSAGTITAATEATPGDVLLNVSTLNSSDRPTVSLVGLVKDTNDVTVDLASKNALDGLRPRVTIAKTIDTDLNGQINSYMITFDEEIFGTFNGSGFTVNGYTTDPINSSKTASNSMILGLIEKSSFDTGVTPNITYIPGDLRDKYGNFLADMNTLIESDGAPPAKADTYIYQIYEDHSNLYVSADTLFYNNTPVGLNAFFQLRIEAFDNGYLDYASGEDAFGNTSVMDTTENTGGTSWEYELNYTINQNEVKNPSINVTVYDIDGNNATDFISVILDITAPETMLYAQLVDHYIAPFSPISLAGTDDSGIYRTRYKIDSGPWINYTGPFKLGGYGVGEHTVYYYSIDMVNNTETIKSKLLYVTYDWTNGVPAFGSYSNMGILGCNLTINDALTFENVTLIINSTSINYPQWINVTSTGKFNVWNSTIISFSSTYRSRFIMNGTLNMFQSTVGELWVESSTSVGGLEIYKNSAVIENCRFYNASGPAVYIKDSNPYIGNTTLEDSDTGISISDSAPMLYQNTFRDLSAIGIKIENNSAGMTLEKNTFNNIETGIYCEDIFKTDAMFRISDNQFTGITNRAIYIDNSYSATSQLMIDNNTLENVGGGIFIRNINGSPILILDNTIKNLSGNNIGIASINNQKSKIQRNTFTNIYGDVIRVRGSTGSAMISNNDIIGGTGIYGTHNVFGVYHSSGTVHIDNNLISGISNSDGIGTWDNENNTIINIKNNKLLNNNYGSIWFSEFADNILVENNDIEKNCYGIWGEHLEQDSNDIITIKNNKIKNSTRYTTWAAGTSIADINNLVLEDNFIYNSAGNGIEIYRNVWGTLTLDNNLIENCKGYGFYLSDTSVNISKSIKNNSFVNNNNGQYGIYIDFNPGTWHINDNITFIKNYPYFDGSSPDLKIYSGGNISFASTVLDHLDDITINPNGMIYAYDTRFSGPSYYDFDVFGDMFLSNCIVEYASEVLLDDPGNVYMTATTFRYCGSNGLRLKNTNMTLMNLIFVDNSGNGLYLDGGSSTVVRQCVFDDNNGYGLYGRNFFGNITDNEFYYNSKDNIRLVNSGGIIYYNMVYRSYADNIHLIYSNTTIKKNVIHYADDYGIYLDHSNAHILLNNPDYEYDPEYMNWGTYDCYIDNNDIDGIYIYYSYPHIENNTIYNNDKAGISLVNSGGHIEYNEISYNMGNGIGQFNPDNPNIHDNYLHDNGDSPPNRAPSAQGGTITPLYPIYSSVLRITPVGWSDPDGDPPGFIYQWQINSSGTWTNLAGATGSALSWGFVGGDEIRCRLTPWDGKTTGTVVNSSSTIINNSAPSITSVSISPSPAYDNSALTAVPNGFSDPDADTTQVYYYQWYNQSGQLSGATSATLPPSKFKANDTIYCYVTPSDGHDNGSSVKSVSVLIIHYTDPGQGVADYDGDGVPDAADAFPYDSSEWRDTDLDGIGDNADTDRDGDGVNNTLDAFPLDKSEIKDSDSDGIGDNSDQDDDNDGYLDARDAFPFNASEWRDTDNDNIGDNSDDDIDGDGINNTVDVFPYNSLEFKDSDSDGVGDYTDQDDDDDGIYDLIDAFPLDPNEYLDTDRDGIGDNTDTDDDGDGYLDDWEATLGTDNKSSLSKPLDTDNDGVPDGDSTNSKGWMDIDDDGDTFNDTDEISNNTDPKDPASYPGMPNRAPSITKVSISPTPSYDNSILTAVPEGFSDPDGDTTQVYYYKWYVNNILLSNVTTSYLTPSNFAANDTVYCLVTPSDGTDNGTAVKSMLVLIIHYTEPSDKPKDYDGDGVIDSQDEFPFDKNEWRDTDGDTIGDNSDLDIDGDGVNNVADAFDFDKTEWNDTDSDGIGDNTDPDIDGDGVLNSQDDFPYDDTEDTDTDSDGIGDNSDSDIDGDGVANGQDEFPYDKYEFKDSDNDGIGDNIDQDDDNDGYYDVLDDFPVNATEHSDNDQDGIGDNADTDDDNDGYLDTWENKMGSDSKSYGSKPLDTDGDGEPDGDSTNSETWMDNDDDDDGFSDSDEITAGTDTKDPLSYPGAPNRAPSITSVSITPSPAYDNSMLTAVPEGFNDPDGDTTQVFYYQWYVNGLKLAGKTESYLSPTNFKANDTVYCEVTPSDGKDNGTSLKSNVILILSYTAPGDEPKDYDGDGIPDVQDAFPYDPNEWHDTDGDGIGDNSDSDIDGDGYSNMVEETSGSNPFNANSIPGDIDGDGILDVDDLDIDGDNVNNTVDKFPYDRTETKDSDNDGIGDNADQDDDNDGTLDSQDKFPFDSTEDRDSDNDGIGDNSDTDLDGDGVLNGQDDFPYDSGEWKDTDGDGIGDNADTDDDGDGIIDIHDAFPEDSTQWRDTDGDGMGDNLAGNNPDDDIDGDGVLNDNDIFPIDGSEWLDTDEDGIGDNKDPDDDGDGVSDLVDAYPFDETRWVLEETEEVPEDKAEEDAGLDSGLIILIIIMFIIFIFLLFMFFKLNKQLNKDDQRSDSSTKPNSQSRTRTRFNRDEDIEAEKTDEDEKLKRGKEKGTKIEKEKAEKIDSDELRKKIKGKKNK